jgi:hypothetical protein
LLLLTSTMGQTPASQRRSGLGHGVFLFRLGGQMT